MIVWKVDFCGSNIHRLMLLVVIIICRLLFRFCRGRGDDCCVWYHLVCSFLIRVRLALAPKMKISVFRDFFFFVVFSFISAFPHRSSRTRKPAHTLCLHPSFSFSFYHWCGDTFFSSGYWPLVVLFAHLACTFAFLFSVPSLLRFRPFFFCVCILATFACAPSVTTLQFPCFHHIVL